MSKKHNALRFPSGRVKWMVASRHALAKAIATAGGWYRLKPDEMGAAETLYAWGMIERNSAQPEYARWSILHEKPRFKDACQTLKLYGGIQVHHLSAAQCDMLCIVFGTGERGHRVSVVGSPKLQRMLAGLERRELVTIERDVHPGVWCVRIAPTYPGHPARQSMN